MSTFCSIYTALSGDDALPSLSPSGTAMGNVEARSRTRTRARPECREGSVEIRLRGRGKNLTRPAAGRDR